MVKSLNRKIVNRKQRLVFRFFAKGASICTIVVLGAEERREGKVTGRIADLRLEISKLKNLRWQRNLLCPPVAGLSEGIIPAPGACRTNLSP